MDKAVFLDRDGTVLTLFRSKPSLRIMTLNVDCGRNTRRVISFLKSRQPEVVCLQEVLERDLPRFADAIGGTFHFAAMTRVVSEGIWCDVGIGILSKIPLVDTTSEHYVGTRGVTRNLTKHDPAGRRAFEHRILLVGKILKDDAWFTIATTHFTWVPDGKPDDFQRQDLQKLLYSLQRVGEVVFCADMNSARGTEIFDTLASHFKDNVPLMFITSLDPEQHKARGVTAMVDGIFSTSGYEVKDVRMIFGPSDHAVLTATVTSV